MKPPPPPPPYLLLLLLTTVVSAAVTTNTTKTPLPHPPTPSPTSSPAPTATPSPATRPSTHPSPLDPKQVRALQSLNLPSKDPCSRFQCDSSKPFSHLLSLNLSKCSDAVSLSFTVLKSLSTLQNLSFSDCPVTPIRFPTELSLSLQSFSSINSLRRISAVFLARFVNLTDLTVKDVPISGSGIYVVVGNMHKIRSLTLSNTNMSGNIPKHFHNNLTHIDFSANNLKGKIPTSLTLLENLQFLNLSSNGLDGEIPADVGSLITLKTLSLASNSFSGPVPASLTAIPGLVHLDLSSNQFNGTIPKFLTEMNKLKHLNLANNQFHGVLPFNASFLKRLEVFEIGGNTNLCYNHTVLSSKLKLGIARCDKHGFPMSPPPSKEESEDSTSDYDESEDDTSSKDKGHHGPNKVVLGIAIGLSSLVFLIVFLICLSRRCT